MFNVIEMGAYAEFYINIMPLHMRSPIYIIIGKNVLTRKLCWLDLQGPMGVYVCVSVCVCMSIQIK